MRQQDHIFVAGHRGLVGSARVRALLAQGYGNVLALSYAERLAQSKVSILG